MAVKVAVIYYSATGNVYRLAQAIKEGAEEAGAEVRFRKVHELAPEEAIRSNQGWSDHALMTEDVPEASRATAGRTWSAPASDPRSPSAMATPRPIWKARRRPKRSWCRPTHRAIKAPPAT